MLTWLEVLDHQAGEGAEKDGIEPSVGLSFRPNDPLSQRVSSTATASRNILVKITVPKRSGRKRKRGSDEPFEEASSPPSAYSTTASDLLQRMRDNKDRYIVEPLGIIEDTHRFEHLPDYQVRASEVPIMRELRDHVMTPKYEKLKDFNIDLKPGWAGITSFPGPPIFAPTTEPFGWQYRHVETARKPKQGPGRPRLLSLIPKLGDIGISLDSASVPQGPPAGLIRAGALTNKAIRALKRLLESRPIVTIRAAESLLPKESKLAISKAVQYVGYYIMTGPWMSTIVRYGVDPRSDTKYRRYQTVKLTLRHSKEINVMLKKRKSKAPPHVFDGQSLSNVGVIWQLCDLTDPAITQLVNTDEIRTECDSHRWGWYHNGTIAKIRVVFYEKMSRVINNRPMPGDQFYNMVTALPNQLSSYQDLHLETIQTLEMRQLARDVGREAVKGPPKHYRILQSGIEESTAAGNGGSGAEPIENAIGEGGQSGRDAAEGLDAEADSEDDDDDESPLNEADGAEVDEADGEGAVNLDDADGMIE